jgi:hypothetical protein
MLGLEEDKSWLEGRNERTNGRTKQASKGARKQGIREQGIREQGIREQGTRT